ncbi:MAG: hypothetical protein AAF089_18460 [Bacteroidota bacterium]
MRALLASFLLALILAAPALAQPASASGEGVTTVDGVAMMLPAGWASTPAAFTTDGVRRIVAEEGASSSYPGAKLVVEVLPGLNRLQQERWLRGQLLRGLDASYEIEPVPTTTVGGDVGAAVSFSKGGHRGYALYTRGGASYSVRLSAPSALWDDASTRQALIRLMQSIRVAG